MKKKLPSILLIILPLFFMLANSNLNFFQFNLPNVADNTFYIKNAKEDKQKIAVISSIRDDVGIQQLIDSGYNGSGVIMGIIDSGVNSNPSEFEDRILEHKSFVSTLYGYSNNITSTEDDYNHGSLVATLMIGKISGMAPGAHLYSAKLFDTSVTGNSNYAGEETSRGIIEAIKWLVDEKNASVINLSLGQYHNMYNEGREYWINKYSLEKEVIFVISAGNEASGGENLGSVGNPGSSLQAITVGRNAVYSSNGPRYDNALKPDVIAPGIGTGTSFSSPVVAGSVATLISALKANNIDYTPGTIKAALISTATPVLNNPYREGTGTINASAAFELIYSSTKTNITLPDIITPFPSKLPYFPITKLFTGQRMSFNLTLVASGIFEGTISISGIPSTFFDLATQVTLKDSSLLPISIKLPEDALTGSYSGKILISTNRNAYSVEIDVSFEIIIPNSKILIDFGHSGIINQVLRVGDSLNSFDDPWTSSFLWGSYQRFLSLMTENNISITTTMNQELENLTFLNTFDVVLLSNPATKLTGTFTDWWNDLTYFPESSLTINYHPFTNKELNTLKNFVNNNGGHVQIFTSYPSMIEIDELNSLLNIFNLSYQNDVVNQKFVLESISSFLSIENITIDYVGGTLRSTNPQIFQGVFFEVPTDTTPVFAYWNSPSNGSVFVSGSSYMLEFGLSDLTANNNENSDFYLNLLSQTVTKNLSYIYSPIPTEFLEPIITEPTNPSTTSSISNPSTSSISNPSTSSISTLKSSTGLFSSSVTNETTAGGFLIMFVFIGLFLHRRRQKIKREL